MATASGPLPPALKPIQPLLTIGEQLEHNEPVISFYVYKHAMQLGIKEAKGDPEANRYLGTVVDIMEEIKKRADNKEPYTNDTVGHSHLKDYALKLFAQADNEDRAGRFNKNMMKSYYTSSFLLDALKLFGELPDEIVQMQKYAKYKAAEIARCLDNGIQPTPGPPGDEEAQLSVPQPTTVGFESYNPGNVPPGGQYPGYPEGRVDTYTPPPDSSHDCQPHPPPGSVRIDPPRPELVSTCPKPQSHHPPSPPKQLPKSQLPLTQQQPPPTTTPISLGEITPHPDLTIKEYSQVTKYCRNASSALDSSDANTAISNLTKALRLLQTGKDICPQLKRQSSSLGAMRVVARPFLNTVLVETHSIEILQPPPTTMPPLPFSGITPHPGLTFEEYSQASKYCRYASSALDFEDANTAITNVTKALRLLETGKDC